MQFVIALYAISYSSIGMSQQTNTKVIFYSPTCQEYAYPEGSVDVKGETIFFKPKNAYCTKLDINPNKPHWFSRLIDSRNSNSDITELDILSFTITNEDFIRSICNRINSKTKRIFVFTQEGLPKYGTNKISRCAIQTGVKNVRSGFRGREGDFDSFHPKIIVLDFDDGSSDVYTSSGNPTTGSELYYDHITLVSLPTKSKYVRWHKCVSSIFTKDRYSTNYSDMRNRYRRCEKIIANQNEETINSYLLPFDRQEFLNEFSYYLGRSKSVRIMVQGADAGVIRDLLNKAQKHGTKLLVLRDDDLYWASKYPVGADHGLFNTRDEYEKWMKPVIEKGANDRYLQTNHHFSMRNFVHAKFVIFDLIGGDPAVYFGSANLTNSALYRNFENVYFTENKEIADHFSKIFDHYWSRSATNPDEMPLQDYLPVIEGVSATNEVPTFKENIYDH